MKKFASLLLVLLLVPILKSNANSAPNAQDIISRINIERENRGLSPLKENNLLNEAAQNRAKVLASEGRLYHVTAVNGEEWPTLADVGYNYQAAGENLATVPPATMEVVPAWMASSAHRANILESRFEDVGVGIAVGPYMGGSAYYVVAYFGTPKDVVSESKIVTENGFISAINSETLNLSKATTREEKIPIIIKLIGLLKSYLSFIEA